MDYNADGHRLDITLGPDYTLTVEIICPIAGCKARWHAEQKPADAPDCWLEYTAQTFGSEFLEWWCTGEGGNTTPVKLSHGPHEIEWASWGVDEDNETYWRPVRETEIEEAHPLALARAAA